MCWIICLPPTGPISETCHWVSVELCKAQFSCFDESSTSHTSHVISHRVHVRKRCRCYSNMGIYKKCVSCLMAVVLHAGGVAR